MDKLVEKIDAFIAENEQNYATYKLLLESRVSQTQTQM